MSGNAFWTKSARLLPFQRSKFLVTAFSARVLDVSSSRDVDEETSLRSLKNNTVSVLTAVKLSPKQKTYSCLKV